jgi:Kef-type K+ transport system membrane component KefB
MAPPIRVSNTPEMINIHPTLTKYWWWLIYCLLALALSIVFGALLFSLATGRALLDDTNPTLFSKANMVGLYVLMVCYGTFMVAVFVMPRWLRPVNKLEEQPNKP